MFNTRCNEQPSCGFLRVADQLLSCNDWRCKSLFQTFVQNNYISFHRDCANRQQVSNPQKHIRELDKTCGKHAVSLNRDVEQSNLISVHISSWVAATCLTSDKSRWWCHPDETRTPRSISGSVEGADVKAHTRLCKECITLPLSWFKDRKGKRATTVNSSTTHAASAGELRSAVRPVQSNFI